MDLNNCQLKVMQENFLNFYEQIGNNNKISPNIIAGPCSMESYEQMESIIRFLVQRNITNIRVGIYKPRTSPYDFQGLENDGVEIIKQLKGMYSIKVISEIVSPRHIDKMKEVVDMFQVGARNMSNYELLKELGKVDIPVLLKRGISATIDEFLYAAEYIIVNGNSKVSLCERGIRTFETQTRNTLDIACIALIKKYTQIPIIVDVPHSLGRKDIINQIGQALLALGVDGIMVEVHPKPQYALSDSRQQLNFSEFDCFIKNLTNNIENVERVI